MNRLKLLAAAMLLAVPIISACGDDIPPPPPTGSIDGLVSIEGQGVDAVSVTLSNGASATTANGGMYRFDGVEAGAYTVTISNYPADASFDQTSAAATIANDGETVTINFPGTFIRTSSIMGTVTVDNEGLSGITVKLSGTGDSETLTDGNGQYAFTGLRAGNYTIEISGFDADDVAFGSTSSAAMVAVGESKVVPFEGTYLRTSAITGQVSVEGNPLSGVTVSMQGRGEDETVTTNGAGQFTFSELRSGDYSVGISGFDIDEYSFEVTSQTVTVAHGETATVPFDGTLLRTAGVMGTVTVEGTGLPGVTVTINGQGEELEEVTNATGYYAFADLHAGEYTIGITGYDDDEYEFEATSQTVTVELQETATAPFDGIMLRTAGIEGTVTVEGHALPGVTVTISGGPKGEEHTRTTNDAGYYMVDRLHAGDYAVAISDFDANEYEFPSGTTTTITVDLRTTETVAFQGDLLRTAGISGRVSVEGTGLDGIMVTMSGDADATAMTAGGGQYAFTGLAEGDYAVAIAGWDEAAYSFEMTEADVPVGDGAAVVQNFDGMHTRTASVSGMLFLDEVNSDMMYTDGEPAFAHAGVPLLLQGPGVNDVQFGMTMEDGSYEFDGLMAGSYRVLINVTDSLTAMLTAGGFRYSGELTGAVVSVAAAEEATINFPFRIVIQTIFAGAVMGYDTVTGYPVGGVGLELYATAEALASGTNMLGMATTDSTGAAKFDFPRAMDLGPGGQGTDHLVFVKVTGTGHDDLVVSDNAHIEIEYAATDRVSNATTAVRLLNLGVNFQWSAKSNADAKDGNEFLEGWAATNGMETGEDGKGTYSGRVDIADAGMPMTVALDTTGQPDMGEKWTQSDALTYMHNPLVLPAMNSAEMNDLGPIYVTYTTQRLVLGVYREADDVEGYSDYRSPGLARGDHRPNTGVGNDMTVDLMVRDSRGRLQTLEYDHDFNDETDPIEARGDFRAGGMKTFTRLPADQEITARFRVGANRVLVSEYSDIEAFGQDLDLGATVGAFGDMSGAGPEVRLCTASSDSSDDWCATYGYQWMTGAVHGDVGDERGHAVMLDPTTGHGATDDSTGTSGDNANTAANEGGNYAFYGVQDGEYEVMAISGSEDYSIAVTPANPNPQTVTVYHDEYADEEDEMGLDTTWVGTRGTASATWRTTRQGLSVRGYVGNDDGDNLMRGDEALEGVTLTLYRGGRLSLGRLVGATRVASTTTDSHGYYAFDNLADAGTSYRVRASSGSGYRAWRYLPSRTRPENALSGATRAMVYPELPNDTDLNKPRWTGSGTTNSTSRYTDDNGTTDTDDDVTGTWQNFALVHENGTVVGVVSNSSGSNGNIDVRITTPFGGDAEEVTTGSSGGFELAGVLEGSYTATIEDVGWAVPLLGADGMPDDDVGEADEDGDGVADSLAATSVTGNVTGRNDYEGLGTLHVYSTTASRNDTLGAVMVQARMHGTDAVTYNDTTTWDTQWTRSADDVTENTSSLGTISWASASVRFTFGTRNASIPTGASVELEAANGECSGATCEVGFFETGDNVGGADAREDTITVMVTSANGYNDHAYTVMVSRRNPVGNTLAATNITRADTTNHAADSAGTGTDAFTFTTTGASSVNIVFGLTTYGDEDNENAYCAQRVSVKPTGGNALTASEDDGDDVCPDTRYQLSASASPGTSYDVTVTSEDGEEKTYNLRVIDGG